ncbi:MAG: HD domain-containing phosphohydrolase [Phycisphaerales bacterium JB038]
MPRGLGDEAAREVAAAREAEGEGRWETARGHYESAVRACAPDTPGRAVCALLRWTARTWMESGDGDAAWDCLEAALAVAVAAGDDLARASTLNSRAGLLFARGDLDGCEVLFREVKTLARRAGDRVLMAMADQNLGSVASVRGDPDLALLRFQASLEGFRGLDLVDRLPPLLSNIARLSTDLEDWATAERALDEASTLCADRGDRGNALVVELNRGRYHLARGNDAAALMALDRARGFGESGEGSFWWPEIMKSYGTLFRRTGRTGLARAYLGRAESEAERRGDRVLLADVAREWAVLHRGAGDSRATLVALNRAHRLFREVKARRELADVDRRLADLESQDLAIVREWGESIESADAYTQGHCTRVAEYACRLAEAAGLPSEDLRWFRMGALLHDVGKVVVPEAVLKKPGRLTDEEFAVMKRHPEAGVELLDGIDFPWDVRPMIRHHHEKWCGGGYPDGVAGEAIPFAARILTVADVWDALTTTRSYRAAYDETRAISIMDEEAGRTLDPELYALFRADVVGLPGDPRAA